ncbi:MAG: hypothetical protein IPK20_00320 [Betaproteobacteria bacterium]|nr:hypothetical protein [Betaproteobacteria bacterium]
MNALFFVTFLAFMLFRNVDGGNRVELLGAMRLEFLLGSAAVAMAIAKISGQPVQLQGSQKIIVAICLLFAMMIIQVPFAADPFEAKRVFTDRAYKFAFLTFLIAALVESPTSMSLFIWVFLYSVFHITLEPFHGLVTGNPSGRTKESCDSTGQFLCTGIPTAYQDGPLVLCHSWCFYSFPLGVGTFAAPCCFWPSLHCRA